MKLADVAQRLDQDIRLADRFLMHGALPFGNPIRRRTIKMSIIPFDRRLVKIGPDRRSRRS